MNRFFILIILITLFMTSCEQNKPDLGSFESYPTPGDVSLWPDYSPQATTFNIKVYPNPVVREVYANLPDACQHPRDIQIRVTDMYGRHVGAQTVAPRTVNFEIQPIEQLEAGIYVIQFWVNGKLEQSTSIIKQ